MRIDKVITSFTADYNYAEFVGPSCLAWNKLYGITPTVAYIKTGSPLTDKAWEYNLEDLAESDGISMELVLVENIPEIVYGVQARATRMYLASCYTDTINMVVDVDMIMLHKDFLGFADNIPDDHFVQFGYDHPSFQRYPDIGKWPMDKTVAKGSVWREIVNPDGLAYRDWIMSQTGFEEDRFRTSVYQPFNIFCDESLLKAMLDRWDSRNVTRVRRDQVPCECPRDGRLYGRLYSQEFPTLEGVDISKYYEVHGPRPLSKNKDWYEPALSYLKDVQ